MNTLFNRITLTWKSLRSNKLRTFLTLLGIVIGISSVIILISLGNSVKSSITSQITSLGANNITVTPGKNFSATNTSTFTQKDVDVIKTIADNASSTVTWQSNSGGTASYKSNSAVASVIGVSVSYWDVNGIDAQYGRITSQKDNDNIAQVVVLGSVLSEKLFKTEDPLGKSITISNVRFTVIGVLKAGGVGLTNNDDNCIVPITTLQTYLTGKNTVGQITVHVGNKDQVTSLQNKIISYLRVSRGIPSGEESDFQAITFASVLDTVNSVISTLTYFLAAIAAISLVVGGIGIMNIMFVSVSERTKEVGLRKALGANNNDILMQFLIEAVFVTVLGGVIGVIIGVALSIVISLALDLGIGISVQSILLSLGVSASIGIIFGIYPAKRASELVPIEALRSE